MRTRVLILYGGRSAEHEVSKVSALAVAETFASHLDDRFEVVPVFVDERGRWMLVAWQGEGELPATGTRCHIDLEAAARADEAAGVLKGDDGEPLAAFDVAFPVLHGPFGEDGTIQALFELAGVAYVGAGVLGSAVGMDKVMTKKALAADGLPTPAYVWASDNEWRKSQQSVLDSAATLGLPCFVKPAALGSSVGISKAESYEQLEAAIGLALEFDTAVIIEEAITGREIECAVLGNDELEVSIPGEIRTGHEFYDYEAKYTDGEAELLVPAPLDEAATGEVRDLAARAYKASRLEGMARVDFFYEEGGRGFLVNEVNTIPGFTRLSLYPRLFEQSGLSYAELLERLVDLAFERRARRARYGRPRR